MKTFKNYDEIVNFLEARNSQIHGHMNKVEVLRVILEQLNIVINPEKVCVVAGTNGKGTTCAALESLLLSANVRVGLFSSPHLVNTTERIRINRQQMDKEKFISIFQKILPLIYQYRLTHFECLTLIAVIDFFSGEFDRCVDFAIFEVGLGGMFDATNALPHKFSVITKIGLDHTAILGNSLEEIAVNKFGIIQKSNTVIRGNMSDSILNILNNVCNNLDVKIEKACNFETIVDTTDRVPVFFLKTKYGQCKLNLPGMRACENCAIALTVFKELGYVPSEHLQALDDIMWAGRGNRLEIFEGLYHSKCPVLISGDHNPQGIESLLDLLKFYKKRKTHFVVAIGKDKDASSIIKLLCDQNLSELYMTQANHFSRPITEYNNMQNIKYRCADPQKAILEAVCKACEDDLIVVTGSLYLVGAILKMCDTNSIK